MHQAKPIQRTEAVLADYDLCQAECDRTDRLVVIEPDTLLRESLVHLLVSHLPDVRIDSAPSAAMVKAGPATLVLFGADPHRDSDLSALTATVWAAREMCEGAPIGAYLLGNNPKLLRTLAALGVVGVVPAEAGAAVAIASVHLMMVGGYCMPPEDCVTREAATVAREAAMVATSKPVEALDNESHESESLAPSRGVQCELNLTSRECDVLRILREGRQNKLIAFQLGISESTVKVHLRNIMKKLNVSNRTQVVLGAAGLDSQ